MHEGYWSTVLGLPGWPAVGVAVVTVMRDCNPAAAVATTDTAARTSSRPAPQVVVVQ